VSSNRVFSGELRPQFTQAYELGYDYAAGQHQLALVASKSTTQHEIRYNPSFYRNSNLTDDVLRQSLTGSYSFTMVGGTKLSANARWQQAEFANGLYEGQTLGLVPSSIYTVSVLHPLTALSKIGLNVLRVSKQDYDVAPESSAGKEKMPAFSRIDLFWNHQEANFEYKIVIKNLMNSISSNYGGYGYVQSPGATGSSRYYYFPSDPRSIHLGITYRY
jgi:hypothetical protein